MTLTVRGAVYIVKDLVPDLTQFYKQYKSIEPYLQNDNPPEGREFLQSQEDRKKLDGCVVFRLLCLLCRCVAPSHQHPMPLLVVCVYIY